MAADDAADVSWADLERILQTVQHVIHTLVSYMTQQRTLYNKSKPRSDVTGGGVLPTQNHKYKTNMCRDVIHKGRCPRGDSCMFAHSAEEMERY